MGWCCRVAAALAEDEVGEATVSLDRSFECLDADDEEPAAAC